jgi:hypothetical protein
MADKPGTENRSPALEKGGKQLFILLLICPCRAHDGTVDGTLSERPAAYSESTSYSKGGLMTTLPTTQSAHRSHLFSVRLWIEAIDDHQVELRGQVQHVLSGETHYFRYWATLVALLDEMLASQENDVGLYYPSYTIYLEDCARVQDPPDEQEKDCRGEYSGNR